MLRRIILWSIRRRAVVLVAGLAIAWFGVRSAADMSVDVLPSFAPPLITVATEALGFSPTQVEQLVTLPIESAINGTQGLTLLRSRSAPGVSLIDATFASNTDAFRDAQLVAARLQELAGQLPAGVEPPLLTPLLSSVGAMAEYALVPPPRASPGTLPALRTFGDFTIRPRLLAVPGVAEVQVLGSAPQELDIVAQTDRLAALHLSLGDLAAAAGSANALAASGYLVAPGQEIPIVGATLVRTPADLAAAPFVLRGGTPIPIGQAAAVALGHSFPVGAGSFDTDPAVILRIFSQPGAPTVDVDRGVTTAFASIARGLPRGVRLHAGFREATVIERAVGSLKRDLALGGLLVAVVLLSFLGRIRTAILSLIAIPLSLLAAFLVLRISGASVNAMTLAGLALAIGEVVDDSVIDVENIWRRLRLDAHAEAPRHPLAVVYHASIEVRGSVVYATFAVALLFVPVFLLRGVPGRMFRPLGLAYLSAVFASLVVAATVVPALAYLLLPRAAARAERRAAGKDLRVESRFAEWLKRGYTSLAGRFVEHWVLVAATSAVLVALAILGALTVHGGFLPRLNESYLVVHMDGPPSLALDQTAAVERTIARRLLAIRGVASATARIGRSKGIGEDVFPPSSGEIDVALSPSARAVEVAERIRTTLVDVPGFAFSVQEVLAERISELVSGAVAPIVATLYGSDETVLSRLAREATARLAGVPGLVDVRVSQPPTQPQLTVTFRPDALGVAGIDAATATSALATLLYGRTVGQTWRGTTVMPIWVGGVASLHESLDAIRHALLPIGRTTVPLDTLASVTVAPGPTIVFHIGGQRAIQVYAGAAPGRALSEMTHRASAALSTLGLPEGYSVAVTGEWRQARAAYVRLLGTALLALLGVLLLLDLAFNSFRAAVLVLVNVPLALVGGVAALLLSGGHASLGSAVGFVTLFGIATRNGIMLVSHYEHLQEKEGVPFGRELVVRGAAERLAPILMTALATALGLLPIALGLGGGGSGIEEPLALVVLGGIVTSTLLNMVVVPALYLRFGGRVAPTTRPRTKIERDVERALRAEEAARA